VRSQEATISQSHVGHQPSLDARSFRKVIELDQFHANGRSSLASFCHGQFDTSEYELSSVGAQGALL
jgi:hypothetical protein